MAKKSTRSAKDQLLRIFLSHKSGDWEAAKAIRDRLKHFGRGRLDVFVSEELPKGSLQTWQDALIRQLKIADTLVLLYTDPLQDWDWCLYESGFFHGKHDRERDKRLVVLHDERKPPPKPLQQFQTVPVSPDQRHDVQRFIYELFALPRSHMKPINSSLLTPRFAREREALENIIIKAVCCPAVETTFAREICIQTEKDKLQAAKLGTIPQDAQVKGDTESLALFGIEPQGEPEWLSWETFYTYMKGVDHNAADWAAALAKMMHSIAFTLSRLPSTGLPLYRDSQGGKSAIYRPAITAFQRNRGTLTFRVLFIDLPRETTVEPEEEATWLTRAVRLGRMLRNGVIADLKNSVDQVQQKLNSNNCSESEVREELAKAVHGFRDMGSNVYVEGRNGGYDREKVRQCFDKAADRAALNKVFDDWDALYTGRATELANDPEIKLQDAARLAEDALSINKRFLELCAKKFCEIVQEP